MSHTPQPGIIIQMMEARQACRELMGVMLEENTGLINQSSHEVETRLHLKKRLALRLEKLLADIKQQKTDWRGNRDAENLALRLAEEIQVFQDIAAKNELLLKSAHRIRADVVAVIRDAIEASQPRVQTYNAYGMATNGTAGTTVVTTNI